MGRYLATAAAYMSGYRGNVDFDYGGVDVDMADYYLNGDSMTIGNPASTLTPSVDLSECHSDTALCDCCGERHDLDDLTDASGYDLVCPNCREWDEWLDEYIACDDIDMVDASGYRTHIDNTCEDINGDYYIPA